MALHSLATPAFGKADLSNCEREEIHLAGSIQPHGALLVVSEPDHRVIQASANAAEFLNLKQVDGMALADLDGDLLVRILPHLDPTAQGMPIAVRCRIGSPGADYDGLLHRPPEGGLVIELERAGPSVDLTRYIAKALEKIRTASSIRALCEEAATLFQDRTGYDRVMVYRFDDEGHGEVFSERRKPELEAYLGNRYPATDIPQMARRLYERTRVRVLVDVNYQPVPLQPRFSPITGRDLDMSLCFLRSMSPIHLQYLKNMGVGATLVISLVVGGKLWGLVACHHYEPRFIHFELRAVCELLAEAIATRIAALESFALGDGHAQDIPFYVKSWPFPSRMSHRTHIAPPSRVWIDRAAAPFPSTRRSDGCVWREHGMWAWNEKNQKPVVLQADYFSVDPRPGHGRRRVEFYRDFYAPFVEAFAERYV